MRRFIQEGALEKEERERIPSQVRDYLSRYDTYFLYSAEERLRLPRRDTTVEIES